MKDIVIVGAGGFGREVAWLIEDINKAKPEWNILGFVDDNPNIQGSLINEFKVIGTLDWLSKQSTNVVFAIGNPITKKKLVQKLSGSKNLSPILIHPSVMFSKTVSFKEGCIICAGTILTTNITCGKHVILNLSCTVGHDAIIGDYCTVLPGVNVSGNVLLEECVSVGTNSALIQGVKVGANTVIGLSSAVVRDLPENCTAVGVPAKPIKFST